MRIYFGKFSGAFSSPSVQKQPDIIALLKNAGLDLNELKEMITSHQIEKS